MVFAIVSVIGFVREASKDEDELWRGNGFQFGVAPILNFVWLVGNH